MTEHQITSEADLRALMGDPVHELVLVKSSVSITEPMKKYIEQSPFVCLATNSKDDSSDVSPRGDAPRFVHILDHYCPVNFKSMTRKSMNHNYFSLN